MDFICFAWFAFLRMAHVTQKTKVKHRQKQQRKKKRRLKLVCIKSSRKIWIGNWFLIGFGRCKGLISINGKSMRLFECYCSHRYIEIMYLIYMYVHSHWCQPNEEAIEYILFNIDTCTRFLLPAIFICFIWMFYFPTLLVCVCVSRSFWVCNCIKIKQTLSLTIFQMKLCTLFIIIQFIYGQGVFVCFITNKADSLEQKLTLKKKNFHFLPICMKIHTLNYLSTPNIKNIDIVWGSSKKHINEYFLI